MRSSFLLIAFFILQYPANGQTMLTDLVTGKPYRIIVDKNVRGSAFLFEDWKPANITNMLGSKFSDVMIKFDAYENKFFYVLADTTYEFVTKIAEVELFPLQGDTATKMVFKKGFSAGAKLTMDKFVQVLAEGKIAAIKYISKTQENIIGYNVPVNAKEYRDNMSYFFIKDGNAVSQRPGPKLLQEILKDKWATIDAYMKQNQLNAKSEDDCIKAIKYYNTL